MIAECFNEPEADEAASGDDDDCNEDSDEASVSADEDCVAAAE